MLGGVGGGLLVGGGEAGDEGAAARVWLGEVDSRGGDALPAAGFFFFFFFLATGFDPATDDPETSSAGINDRSFFF